MATAIEYGMIAGGISLAIIGAVSMIPTSSAEIAAKEKAIAACAARPAGSTENVTVEYLGLVREYSCPWWPKVFNPRYVATYYGSHRF